MGVGMPIEKIDNTKFFMTNTQSVQSKQTEPTPAVQDKEKSDAAKYMIGATALAATIAIGIVGHKNNWWKGVKNLTPKEHIDIKPNPPKTGPVKTPVNNLEPPQNIASPVSEITLTPQKKSRADKIKDAVSFPFRKIKEKREAKRMQKEAAQKAKREAIAEELAERNSRYDADMRKSYAQTRLNVEADTPNRLARIAKKEEKYADRVQRFWKKDFGDIETERVIEDYNYERVKKYIKTNPEYFVAAPKKGEYDLRHLAVDGYWNGPEGLGASSGTFIPGTELHYNNQFTLHDMAYPQIRSNEMSREQFGNIHWAVQKVALNGPYDTDKRFHIGTALRFSAPGCASDKSRPLGWNIFIEGDIPLEKMKEIKKQLVESGVWARQMAIQNNDTMLEVFNEIIKCLNK